VIVNKFRIFKDVIQGYNFEDSSRNGEFALLRKLLKEDKLTVFDIGANLGVYVSTILNYNPSTRVHCFEPVKFTYSKLESTIKSKWKNADVYLNNFGMGDKQEQRNINLYWDDGGVNSLYLDHYHAELSIKELKHPVRQESIQIDTIDNYLKIIDIDTIDLVKIDVEGHESRCILGAKETIIAGKIKRIQFEYSTFWRIAGYTLEETHDFLRSNGFSLYRLSMLGKIPANKFNRSMENYKPSNYLAVKNC
jgi:FkbM family methyltransferase